jgi:hypothetical protein
MYIQKTISETEITSFESLVQAKPVVSVESFFIANKDENSIARNLVNHPDISFFYELLQNIRNRMNVQDVLVEITDVEIVDSGCKYLWPFSERIYIISNASIEEIAEWVKPLMPSGIKEGWVCGEPPHAPVITESCRIYAVNWD